jgi:hypothetical protein
MGQYDFLKSLKLKETTTTDKPKTEKTPEILGLRVFKNGRIYPSKALVERFKLEYGVRGECGIDFFSSGDWTLYPKDQAPVIFVAFVPREESKISLFSSYKKTETTEKPSVLTQGPKAPELLELVKTTYKRDDVLFIDLAVDVNIPVTTLNGIYNIPKTIARGPKKGTATYIRRENVVLYPLVPVELLSTPDTTPAKEIDQTDVIETLNSIP